MEQRLFSGMLLQAVPHASTLACHAIFPAIEEALHLNIPAPLGEEESAT